MMAGNPNWWAMFPPSSFNSFADHQPQSWSQLLLGDEDRVLNQTQMSHYQPKKLENWEDQILNNNNTSSSQFEASNFVDNIIVKQQLHSTNNNILHPTSISSHHTNKFLDFSSHTNNNQDHNTNHLALRAAGPDPDHSSESSKNHSVGGSTGGACKKARVHPPSSSQPPLKMRKEKLVDRITALHQIVSPFGKTDTASVLSEAIGYIRFLQGQIEALSYPYLQSAPKDLRNSQPMGEEMMKNEDQKRLVKDLRSKGLCLVPLSCTHLVGADHHSNHNNINNNNNNNINIAPPYWSPL